MTDNVSEKFLKGVSVQTLVSLANGILQIVVFAIFSRLLSRIDFGYYAALMGITTIFMGISYAGIGSAVIQQKQLTDKYCSTAFTISIITGLFVGIVFFLLTDSLAHFVLDEKLKEPLRWMTIPLVLYSINGFAGSLLSRELRFGTAGIIKIISYSTSAIVGIFYAYYVGGVFSLVVLFVLDAITYTILLFSRVGIPKLSIGAVEAKSVISFGGWLTLGSLMSTISNQIDKLVLGKWLSVDRLGAYNRPVGFISNIIGQINTIFDTVLFPILSGFQDSKEQFRRILYSSFGLLTTMGTMLALMLFFNSKLIIHIFFGNEWLDLVPILQISSLSAIFMLNNTLADCFYRSFNLVKIGFFIRMGGIVLTLLFMSIGAQYDILGVTVAILLSNLVVVICKFIYLCYKSNASLGQLMIIALRSWKPSIPVLLLGLVLLLLPQSIMSEIIVAIILSGLCLLLLVRFPRFVGEEYTTLIYPKVEVLAAKLHLMRK